ncbi:hypothetical protein GCM10009727_12740 [Actinomadura napierensis]|uniref:Uncharacterized protein n=1 Tax=Actinomadura napierensis TaxID=267854 RepID=A0ABN2YC55_9ACTN
MLDQQPGQDHQHHGQDREACCGEQQNSQETAAENSGNPVPASPVHRVPSAHDYETLGTMGDTDKRHPTGFGSGGDGAVPTTRSGSIGQIGRFDVATRDDLPL